MDSNETNENVFSTAEVIGLTTFTTIILLLSVPANAFVLIAYLCSPSARRKPSNLLLANVTISEFTTALLVIPLQLSAHTIKTSLASDEGVVCTFVGILSYPFYIVAVGTMVCTSIDRYYAIHSPLKYKVKMTGKKIAAMIAYTWMHATVFVFVFGVIIGVEQSKDSMECGIPWEKLHVVVSMLMAVIHIVLPFVSLAVLNYRLVLLLRRQNRTLENHIEHQLSVVLENNLTRKNKTRQAQERRVACMVLWIIGTYFICWIPYLVTRSLHVTPVTTSPLVDAIAVLILHLSVVINPVLNLTFRKELRLTIQRLFKRRNAVFPIDVGSGTFFSAVGGTANRNSDST